MEMSANKHLAASEIVYMCFTGVGIGHLETYLRMFSLSQVEINYLVILMSSYEIIYKQYSRPSIIQPPVYLFIFKTILIIKIVKWKLFIHMLQDLAGL